MVILLHGIGAGNVKSTWYRALSGALRELGYAAIDPDDVVAPQYVTLFRIDPPPQCPLPKPTAAVLDNAEADRKRREYEQRQGRLERLLEGTTKGSKAVSFPESLVECALNVPAFNLDQAKAYVNNEGLRGCVLRAVINVLPSLGEVIIVGHSLGSLIAIDLLNHLPGDLVVRRLITIGSPAGHLAMFGKKNPLLKKFPLSRVETWVNLWSVRDPVPYGRGISHHFPHALDVRVDLGMCEHAAEAYLRNPFVATAIGDALFGSLCREVTPHRTDVGVPLDDQEKVIVAALAYAHCLADEMKDDTRRQERFRAALSMVQQALITAIRELYECEQRPMPAQLNELLDGRRPAPSALFDLRSAILVMLDILSKNVIAPYEIKFTADQQKKATEALARFLDFREGIGTTILDSLRESRDAVKVKAELKLMPMLGLAAAGAGLFLAGPLGLMAVAPAGLAGGAAIVAALAAFGPGGMIGGLVAAGGLMAAGGGAAGAAVKALVSAPEATLEHAVAQLLATAIARKRLGEPRDDRVWFLLCELEAQIARELQRVEPYSDADAALVKALRRKLQAVRQAIEHMIKHILAPLLP